MTEHLRCAPPGKFRVIFTDVVDGVRIDSEFDEVHPAIWRAKDLSSKFGSIAEVFNDAGEKIITWGPTTRVTGRPHVPGQHTLDR